MTRIRIWHIISEYDTGNGANTTVTFRVKTAAQNGKRMAINFVKESAQARMLKLKNVRVVGRKPEYHGIMSWNAPKQVKRRFYRLRTIENKQIMQEVDLRLKKIGQVAS